MCVTTDNRLKLRHPSTSLFITELPERRLEYLDGRIALHRLPAKSHWIEMSSSNFQPITYTGTSSAVQSEVNGSLRTRQRLRRPLLSLLFTCIYFAPCIAFLQQGRQHAPLHPVGTPHILLRLQQKTRLTTAISMAVAKSGGKIILDDTQFEMNVLNTDLNQPVMVFFTAPWCGPCRLSAPVVKDVMTEYQSQLLVVEVCTDDLPDIAASAGVVSIPTIQMYYRGQLVDTIVGCVARNVLASSVAKVLEDTTAKEEDDDDDI